MPTGSSSSAIGAVSSSVGGADDSDESSESESDDILGKGTRAGVVLCLGGKYGVSGGEMVSRRKVGEGPQ